MTQTMEALRGMLELRCRSQSWLSKQLDVSDATVSRYISGERCPSREMLRNIARLLKCRIEEVTGETDLMSDTERRILAVVRQLPTTSQNALLSFLETLPSNRDG